MNTGAPNFCIDNAGGVTVPGNKIQLWTQLGNSNQQWTELSVPLLQQVQKKRAA